MGRIFVVGMGPGGLLDMTPRARKAIEDANLVVGYNTYINLIQDYFPDKQFIRSGMTREVERCRLVLEKALEGYNVALVSSGDSGIYGMAGIMLEVVNKSGSVVDVEVIPGITAASAAAAVLGAPLMHDFAVISLSDLMTPWELICKRIECAAQGDFVICLYNPKSKNRSDYINIAREIVLKYRDSKTPVGIVRNAGRPDQASVITTLEDMPDNEIDMFTVVLIGNSQTYTENGRMITPRGYDV
ncbi:MAG TPA: precorrin-3B C(17)-methyltransferase [Clostridiaceae bacterium]|nr:precorrin-3B C(17)-methyltransferase [Clostridiaceae bacterium]